MRQARVVLGSLGWCLLLALCVPARAQDSAGADKPKAQKPETTFRVNVRLVNVFTTVTDSHGAPVAGLAKDDFKILEDGVPQTISVFDQESELPLSIVLAVDTSESTRRDAELEAISARKFAHSIIRPIDHLAVFQVSENIDQVTAFTADLHVIDRGIAGLQRGAGTSLYDAIFLGAEALITRDGRKVLVLITDGGDTTSKADYDGALRRAQQAEALVYSIIVVPVANDAGRNLGGEHALIQISKDTGGKYYYAESIEQLDEAFRQISKELRTQYLIGYYPNHKSSESPFHRIQVQITRQDGEGQAYQVRHRAGYYWTPEKEGARSK
jgi:Ca-activated chloride channel homolog